MKPSQIIQDSEYLDTLLIAVPNSAVKDFYKTYETMAPMVVPRSAAQIASDDEFTLFALVAFKKHSAEFVHRAREKRWTPREYKYKEGGKEEEAREVGRLEKEERKLWGDALRLAQTGWSEGAMIWIHVLALRVFVETVLRYGLPLDFVCALVQVRSGSLRTTTLSAEILIFLRQLPSKRKRQKATSTQTTPTWAAMPLVATVKDASRRMTRHCRPRCRVPAIWAIRNTLPMCIMSLKLYSMRNDMTFSVWYIREMPFDWIPRF